MTRVCATFLWLAALTVPAAPVRAQAPVPLLDAEARLADFGVSSAAQVVRGRVSVARTAAGPALGVYFLRDRVSAAPPPAAEIVAAPTVPDVAEDVGDGLVRPEALWAWNTRELLADGDARGAFLAFVARYRFARVFLQLPPAAGQRVQAGFVPFDGAAVGSLVGDLTARGARVYALDGDPSYAFPENHRGVLRTVDGVVEHNRQAPPNQRFAGVRYDVEPYLARGFQGPRRQEILDGYVALLDGIAERTRAAALELGVDVPFWLDGLDEETGTPLTAVLNGERRTVLDHVFTLVDDMAVMDYRTTAAGPDGSVAHAVGELERAVAAGVGVLVAVETGALVDEDLYTFAGTGWAGMPATDGQWIVLGPEQDDHVRLWFVDGAQARQALADHLRQAGIEATSLRHWPAGRPTRVPADKQSFHGLGPERMRLETARAARALQPYPAFLGLAYHHYESLRALLGERPR